MQRPEMRSQHESTSHAIYHRSDYWHGTDEQSTGRSGYKEWSYFCVLGRDVDVLVNFSLMDRRGAASAKTIPRLTLLARTPSADWDGDIEQFAEGQVEFAPGHSDIRMDRSWLRILHGRYHIDAELDTRPLAVSLQLTPRVRPAIASSVRLSRDGGMRWLVVPRLTASGFVKIGSETIHIVDEPAYHDRNWGRFDWGGDFSWEWATLLPARRESPWSLVYMRIGDRFRNRCYSQGLMVWRDDQHRRTFSGRELGVRHHGLLRARNVLRVPRIVSLACPGAAVDVPRKLELCARFGGDLLEIEAELNDMAQLGLPNDGPSGLTLLSEVGGSARVSGRIQGEPVSYTGRILAEFNHAGV